MPQYLKYACGRYAKPGLSLEMETMFRLSGVGYPVSQDDPLAIEEEARARSMQGHWIRRIDDEQDTPKTGAPDGRV